MQINRENQMIRIPLQWLTACVLGALIAAPSIALAGTAKQPNIVLLISDDDDYEHFGFMGSKIAHTPTLDNPSPRQSDRNRVKAVLFSIGEVLGLPKSARAPFWTMISSMAGPFTARSLATFSATSIERLTRHAAV
jgi:hypothetical protein